MKPTCFTITLNNKIFKKLLDLASDLEYSHKFENPTTPSDWWYNDFIVQSEKRVETEILSENIGIRKKDITRNYVKVAKNEKFSLLPVLKYYIEKYHIDKLPAVAVSPGKTLSDKISELGISVEEFAGKSELPVEYIKNLIAGNDNIILWSAGQLQKATGIPVRFWINSQLQYDLWVKQQSDTITK